MRKQAITSASVDPDLCCHMASLGLTELTHWGPDKMDAISQTTCSSAFSWMKMFEFRLKFHWRLLLRAWRRPGNKPLSEPRMESLLTHICVTWPQWVKDNGLEPVWHQGDIWIQRCHLASVGRHCPLKIRQSHDPLIFIMGISIPGKTIFVLKSDPGHY